MAKKNTKARGVSTQVLTLDNVNNSLKAIRDALATLEQGGIDALLMLEGPMLVRSAHLALTKSEARFNHLINRMSAVVVELTPTGNIIYINEIITLVTGFSAEALCGSCWFSLVLAIGSGSTSIENLRKQFLDNGELSDFRTILCTQDGSQRFFSWNTAHVCDADGLIERIICFGTDVTEQVFAEQELRIAAIAFESQEGVMVTNADAIIVRVNQAFTRLTGYSAEEAIGKNPRFLRSGRHDQMFYQGMWNALKNKGLWQGEIWNRRKNGVIYVEWLSISAVKAPDGSVTHYLGSFSDITCNKEASAEINRLAYYDPLTQLANRRLFQDRLDKAITMVGRSGKFCALLFIDLDNFKSLNDTLGHNIGDILLIQVAHRLEGSMRKGDTVARQGGDEFVVMLEALSRSPEKAAIQAKDIGDKILTVLSQPFLLAGYEYLNSASIGITLFNNYKETADDLLKRADIAMYAAKTAGRNILRFFDPEMQMAVIARAALEVDLRQALAKNQFKLYFQSQAYHDRQIIGAEVLLRWEHPERGLVSPMEFITLAEETLLILPIGLWVLEQACAQLKIWEEIPQTQHLQLAVNVSAHQFHQDCFVEQVCSVLDKYAIQPERLKLELTESIVLDNINETIIKMHELKKIGVHFSMDDFGTGYSSLAYLTQLPFDQLKIDQSFVRNIGMKPTDAMVVQTIIGMANNLDMDVIAEGVETEEQRAFLELHGCPVIQGYLFSKPVPIEQFVLEI